MNPPIEDSLQTENNIKAYAAKTDDAGTQPPLNKLARFSAGEGSEKESTHGSIEAQLERAAFARTRSEPSTMATGCGISPNCSIPRLSAPPIHRKISRMFYPVMP